MDDSPLSLGKVFMLTFTLNMVSSFMSQSLGLKGDLSMRAMIALAVALPRVVEFPLAAFAARLRPPPPGEREGMKRGGVGMEGRGMRGAEEC